MDEIRLHSRPQDLDRGTRWVVGAAIFHDPNSSNLSLLLLQRASHESAFPDAWELPGGHVEDDESVAQAVAREVLEETSLVVSRIIGEVEPMSWTSTHFNVQLNYVVMVQGGAVKLNPEEHSNYRWVEEGDAEGLYMTSQMREVVQNAFRFAGGL